MTTIIKRNTIIPTLEYIKELTTVDNQTSFIVKVFEGENPFTVDNNLLGNFELNGIPPAPKGDEEIKIVFDIDPNCGLSVRLEVRGLCMQKNISDKNRLSENKVNRIMNNIEIYRLDEKNELERLNSKNLLESFCYNMKQKFVLNNDGQATKIIGVCEDLLKWVDTNQMAVKDEYDRKLKEVKEICDFKNPAKKFVKEENPLESFCLNMINVLCDEKISVLISEDDKKRIRSKCEETLNWLDINKYSERQLFESKLVDLKKSCLFNFNF